MLINTSYDFRIDAHGKDPDTHSQTLRQYHKFLWSKRLPGGTHFELDDVTPRTYLHHKSDLGEFFLSSDSIIQTFISWKKLNHIIRQFPEVENETFMAMGYTIGGMMIFPSNRINKTKQTINGAKGFNQTIADRMDLTLECIRRYYLNQNSPLSQTLERYSDFFALFENFKGYVDFFLLNDLVVENGDAIKFFIPFNNFAPPCRPQDIHTYNKYCRRSVDFIVARNHRIQAWCLAKNII